MRNRYYYNREAGVVQSSRKSSSVRTSGFSIGCVLAAILSYTVNKSIIWAIIHGFFNWGYVLYHWIVYGKFLP